MFKKSLDKYLNLKVVDKFKTYEKKSFFYKMLPLLYNKSHEQLTTIKLKKI